MIRVVGVWMISGVGLKVTADEKSSVKGRRRPRWEDKHTTKNTFHAYYSTLYRYASFVFQNPFYFSRL